MEEIRALDYLQGEREFLLLLMDRFGDPYNIASAAGTPTAVMLRIPAARALEANNSLMLERHRASYFATVSSQNGLEEKLTRTVSRAIEAGNARTLERHRASYFATQTALNELEEKLFLLEGR